MPVGSVILLSFASTLLLITSCHYYLFTWLLFPTSKQHPEENIHLQKNYLTSDKKICMVFIWSSVFVMCDLSFDDPNH